MIAREICMNLLVCLEGLPGYPKGDAGKAAILNAMQKAFYSERKLRLAVNDVLRYEKRCPVPSDFYEKAAGMGEMDRRAGFKTSYRCFVCYDIGSTSYDFLCSYRDGALIEKQRLTPEQASELGKKLPPGCGGTRQAVYELSVSCACRIKPAAPPANLFERGNENE